MFKKIQMFVKNRDAFGHQVKLTVKNGNGSEQTSTFDGLVTIFLYFFIRAYGVIKTIKMSGGNLDNITSSEEVI